MNRAVPRDQALLKIAFATDLAESARTYIRGRVSASDNGDCWVWQPADSDGYGRAHFQARTFRAHRLSYTVFIGPIPEGLTIDHLCRNRVCVNPAHLEPVTNHENLLRGEGFPGQNIRKTHCPRGHEYTPENTARYPNSRGSMGRFCLECRNAANRRRYAASAGEPSGADRVTTPTLTAHAPSESRMPREGGLVALPTAGKTLPQRAASPPIQLELTVAA